MPRVSNTDYESFVKDAQMEMQCEPAIAWAIGLAGEVGEVTELIKKSFCRVSGEIGYKPLDRGRMVKELGDVMFY